MMRAHHNKKIEALIHFFAVEHKKKSGKDLYKTSLFKYIDLFEFEILKETGIPPLGSEYNALKNGPVPVALYSDLSANRYKSDLVKIEIDEIGHYESMKIIPVTENYSLDIFSDYEMDKLYSLIDRFAVKYKNNQELIQATHEIKAWDIAWNHRRLGDSQSEKMWLKDEVTDSENTIIQENFAAVML